jgi:hypothetical protein
LKSDIQNKFLTGNYFDMLRTDTRIFEGYFSTEEKKKKTFERA